MRTQTALARALAQARERTDEIFGMVQSGSLYERPIPERHRIIFYLGHLEAFDWNLIARYAFDIRSFHPEFDRLFAFGIDPPPGKLPSDKPSDWPGLAEVARYNARVRDEIDAVLDDVPEQLLHVALEHRLMHAETFAYILHNLPCERKARAQAGLGDTNLGPPPASRMIEIAAGTAALGLAGKDGFGWDNEFQAHTVEVPAFAISKYKVTNSDYLEFVRAGAESPFYWNARGGRLFYRGMFAEVPLPLDAPVYVTHDQAGAYARWRGKALPTEAQFHRAAASTPPSANVDFHRWDPVSVTADDGRSPADLPSQMVGNGWEWTSTVFGPFEGFQPFPFYTNYSEPFFDGQHFVLKGAGPCTAACFLRPSFRNWFRPAYPYVHATFRLVES
jgi:iron(II)-dependent oxidoreductase